LSAHRYYDRSFRRIQRRKFAGFVVGSCACGAAGGLRPPDHPESCSAVGFRLRPPAPPKVVSQWVSGFVPPDHPESCTVAAFRLCSSRPPRKLYRSGFPALFLQTPRKLYRSGFPALFLQTSPKVVSQWLFGFAPPDLSRKLISVRHQPSSGRLSVNSTR
jgi:hypothetical protein